MSELDRWGESAAVALLDEVSGAEVEEALAVARGTDARVDPDRRRRGLLALAAAAVVLLVGGLAVVETRDTEDAELPLATPLPGSEPTTTGVPVTTIAPAMPFVSPLAAEPEFGSASRIAYVSDRDILITGSLTDGSPVLWHWTVGDGGGSWTHSTLPGDNAEVPIAFVDSSFGYAFVDGHIQETRTAGLTWEPVDLASPSGSDVSVIGLAIGAGFVHALGVDEAMTFRLYTMPIDGYSFTASQVEFPPPPGGRPVSSFAFDDQSGWMAVTSRILIGVAHFANGQWTAAPDVTCEEGGITFASSGDRGDLVRSCDAGHWGANDISDGTKMEVSSDGGETFSPVVLPSSGGGFPFFTLLARPDARTIVVALEGGDNSTVTDSNGSDMGDWFDLGFDGHKMISDFRAARGGPWVAVGRTWEGEPAVWVGGPGRWTG